MDYSGIKTTESPTTIENPYNPCVNNLSKGILDIYTEPLQNAKKQLKELTTKQNFLVTQIHDENIHLAQVQHDPEIHEIFNKMKVYHNKLINIKKDMKLIYERSTKLKKRALRLQQDKEKEQLKCANEMDLKPAEIIIAQPGNSSSTN